MSSGRELRGTIIIGVVVGLGLCIALVVLVLRAVGDEPASSPPPSTVADDAPLSQTAKPMPIPEPIAPEVPADTPVDDHDDERPPISEEQARAAIAAARARGDRTGIAVFNPPGTKPLKRGIVVPDGMQLPQGYMRHYQTTDGGQSVAPILMFHPDYVPKDAGGNAIAVPENRVVPPELAPPGMPIRYVDLPDDESK